MNALVKQNERQASLVAGAFAAIIALLVFVVLALTGLVVLGLALGVVVGLGAAFLAHWYGTAITLRLSGAVAADPARYARLHNLVEGLCVASGLPKPDLYVIDDSAPNAFAAGRSSKHAVVVVTTGLLESLDRMELEAILAHELSHIKSRDIVVSTLAVTTVGLVAPSLVPTAVGANREARADRSAVELTRFPPALISALEKLRVDRTVLRNNPRALAHLWIETPGDTHPPLEERIAILREL